MNLAFHNRGLEGAPASWSAAALRRFRTRQAHEKRQRTGALQNLADLAGGEPVNPLRPSRLCGAQPLCSLILWVLLPAFPLPAAEPQNTSAIQSLKPGKGREQVQINCIPCHSTAIITATHATRARWDELITTMQQKHGLWPLIPAIRTQLLDYLAATQPPTDTALDAGKQTPWAQPLYRPNPLW